MSATDHLAEALARTHATAFDTERPWSAAEFAALLVQRSVVLIGDAQSFALIRCVVDEAELLTIATDPAARRQGHARQRLDDAMAKAVARGATRLFLEVAADNHAALALYQGAGFERIGTRPGYYKRANQSSVDAHILQRDLTDAAFLTTRSKAKTRGTKGNPPKTPRIG